MLPDVQRYIGVDGLHPNEAGYAQIADIFFQAIQSQLRSAIAFGPWPTFAKATAGRRAALVAEHLTRLFDARVAVRDVSLSVNAGEIVTLLGPNGAGKTTTMRMLAGLILPTAGRISIDGIELTEATAGPRARQCRAAYRSAWTLGAAHRPHQPADLRATAGRRRSGGERRRRRLRHVDLIDRADDIAGKLSKGLKQRVAIARALAAQAAGVVARRADLRAGSRQRPAHARSDPGAAIGRPRRPGLHAQPWRGRGALGSDRRAQDRPARLRHAGGASQRRAAAAGW